MNINLCPVCATPLKLKYRLRFHVYKCGECGLYVSDATFDHSFVSDIDPEAREVGLERLRENNFKKIIAEIKNIYGPDHTKISGLEVGSGSGWWLRACKAAGIPFSGIEPEKAFEPLHKQNGYDVSYGFYPRAGNNEQYDIIIFNDVFEHIPDVNNLTTALYRDLKSGGYLIINIPQSDGFFYTCARVLNRLGIKSYINRMWQFDFHSPHCTYFNADNLTRLICAHGFIKTTAFKLDTLDLGTIKERVTTDKKVNKLTAWFLVAALTILKPIIDMAKPDIKVFFFKKR